MTPRAFAVFSRVEDWRGTSRPVSSPRHLKPGVPISGTGLSWSLRVMGYETYRLGALSRITRYSTSSTRGPDVKSRGLLSLRHDVEPPPQVLQTAGRDYHAAPAFHVVGGIANQ